MKAPCAALCVLWLAIGCGGASQSDDSHDRVGNQDEDDDADDSKGSGKSDDDSSEDDDSADDDSDDAASDDDTANESTDDDSSEDDDSADDDAPPGDDLDDDSAPVKPEPAPTGTTPTPGTPDPSVPVTPGEGCTLLSQSSSTTTCEIRQQCANAYQYSYCSQLASGGWACSCSDGFTSHELEIATDAAPCTTIAEMCGSLENPTFSGEYTCEQQYKNSTAYYCEVQTRCSDEVPLTDEISAVQSIYYYASCYNDGLGGLSCNCSGQAGAKSFSFTGIATADACTAGAALCDGDTVVEPEGDRTCAVTSESAGSGYCQTQQTCSQTVDIGGLQANLTETESASCSTGTDGATSCSCYTGSHSYTFASEARADEPGTCSSAIAVCGDPSEPVPEGPIECTIGSQSASTSYCDAYTQCSQDAAVGDVVVELSGSIYTACKPNGDVWTCQCQTGTTSVPIEVTAEDAWSACTDAAGLCPDMVEVDLSAGGGGSPCGRPPPPPDGAPLPPGGGIPCPL